jgi:hypothetical protein
MTNITNNVEHKTNNDTSNAEPIVESNDKLIVEPNATQDSAISMSDLISEPKKTRKRTTKPKADAVLLSAEVVDTLSKAAGKESQQTQEDTDTIVIDTTTITTPETAIIEPSEPVVNVEPVAKPKKKAPVLRKKPANH